MSSERLDRSNTATPLSRSPLSHPLFLASLLLLVANDHFFKHSDLIPRAISGKLSDFAGLIVAPIVLVALVRARSTASRALCFASIAIVFGAINVSLQAASLFERATALIGVPWSVFSDASDLIGFAAYPLAWSIAEDGVAAPRARERLTLALAAVACAASSPGPAEWNTGAYLINRSERSVVVRLRWARAQLDCGAIEGRAAEVFGPEIFGDTVTFTIEPDNSLPLEEFNAAPGAGVAFNECDVVLVKADGVPDTVIFWTDAIRTSVPPVVTEEDEDDLRFDTSGMIVIDRIDGALTLSPNEGLEAFEVIEAVPDPQCFEKQKRFGWSKIEGSFTAALAGISEGADGCLALDFQLTGRIYVCAPLAGELPFAEGDVLSLTSSEGETSRSLSMSSTAAELLLWSGSLEDAPIDGARPIDHDECGRRLECGGYAIPLSLERDGQTVTSGGAIEYRIDGREVRMMLGSAEHVLAGSDSCERGRDVAGLAADILRVKR